MGLGKKLRADVEKIAWTYLHDELKIIDDNFLRVRDVVDNRTQRIASLEDEVSRLCMLVKPAGAATPRVGTDPVEPGKDDPNPPWCPIHLHQLMRRAIDTADKLPNEVRARLLDFDGEDMDISMLVCESCDGVGSGVPIIQMPILGGTINVLAPADVPTPLSLRAFNRSVLNYSLEIGHINSVECDAVFFDRYRDETRWLPERGRVVFSARYLPSHGYIPVVGGLLHQQLLDKYGDAAGELCLLGHSFIEVQILTPRQDPAGQAPEAPSGPPAPPQAP